MPAMGCAVALIKLTGWHEPEALCQSTAQVGVTHFRVGQQCLPRALHYNPAILQHIGPISDFQRLVGVLFHQEHCHAIAA